ncbi:hypothetical protein [Phyllobacterium endophyticum]|uniref:hypothetical protein n=1 Tax=Phyllobacterium endophyticum TaxID=1149773 RepID=UPI0011B285EA|nr:hypothetical protein [Phyllobacterium endophyticum]MBB3234449.1 hypothetical protein [Phyllobacterium endophyticum]TYR44165.1 hypothetical protein FY050_03115 [Phyllobacterium endophyticum]
MGGYVSVPGIDVFAATKFQMMWSTQQEQLQIVQSGSFFINGNGEFDAPVWQPISWPAMSFIPFVMVGSDRYEIVFQYLSATSGRASRVRIQDAMVTDYPSGETTGYYMITKTPKPF